MQQVELSLLLTSHSDSQVYLSLDLSAKLESRRGRMTTSNETSKGGELALRSGLNGRSRVRRGVSMLMGLDSLGKPRNDSKLILGYLFWPKYLWML